MNKGRCINGAIISWQILVMSHKRIHRQPAQETEGQQNLQLQQQAAASNLLMSTNMQEQAGEPTGLQFVDSMGFVNILVLTDQTEMQQ